MKKNLIFVVVLIVVVINVIIVATIYRQSLSPDSSSAATNVKTVMTLTSPASVTNAAVGSSLTVSVSMQNTLGDSVAELVFSYDPTVLTAVSVNEDSSILLAVNKSVSTPGKITIDIANSGPGDLPANVKLVDLVFTVKSSVASTTVATDPTTTIGYPNQLASSGLGNILLKFILTKCGDGTTQTPNDSGFNEQCDAGTNNGVACTAAYGGTCTYCSTTCTIQTVTGPKCGDSVVQAANGEQCDSGASNGTACTPAYGGTCNYCSSSCKTTTVTGAKCGDGIVQSASGEVCDDGNTSDLDACSSTCKTACTLPNVADVSKCVPQGCRGDYDATNTVDLNDFAVFAQNYHKVGISCTLDIILGSATTGSACYIDIADLSEFARLYKVTNACL